MIFTKKISQTSNFGPRDFGYPKWLGKALPKRSLSQNVSNLINRYLYYFLCIGLILFSLLFILLIGLPLLSSIIFLISTVYLDSNLITYSFEFLGATIIIFFCLVSPIRWHIIICHVYFSGTCQITKGIVVLIDQVIMFLLVVMLGLMNRIFPFRKILEILVS